METAQHPGHESSADRIATQRWERETDCRSPLPLCRLSLNSSILGCGSQHQRAPNGQPLLVMLMLLWRSFWSSQRWRAANSRWGLRLQSHVDHVANSFAQNDRRPSSLLVRHNAKVGVHVQGACVGLGTVGRAREGGLAEVCARPVWSDIGRVARGSKRGTDVWGFTDRHESTKDALLSPPQLRVTWC